MDYIFAKMTENFWDVPGTERRFTMTFVGSGTRYWCQKQIKGKVDSINFVCRNTQRAKKQLKNKVFENLIKQHPNVPLEIFYEGEI